MPRSFSIDDLATMTERSVLFQLIKAEMIKRGHWKNKSRGIPQIRNLKKIERGFTTASIHSTHPSQVRDENAFNDWGA